MTQTNNRILREDEPLLNADKTSNFIYEIKDIEVSESFINEINLINTNTKIRDRIQAIEKAGGKLVYKDMENDVFKNNLILIDSMLPQIISEMVLTYYKTTLSTTKMITSHINEINPLGFDKTHAHAFYEYKMKRFLADVAVGMTPSKVWSGVYDATGGYLVVKKDGEVLCYHLYNRNLFEDYLFESTYFDTASTTRFGFGDIYTEADELFLKLNLQIRFK